MVGLRESSAVSKDAVGEDASRIGRALVELSLKLPEWGTAPDKGMMLNEKLRELMAQLAEARFETAIEYGACGNLTTSSSNFAEALLKEIVIECGILSTICREDDIAKIIGARTMSHERRHEKIQLGDDKLVVMLRGCARGKRCKNL